MIRLPPPFAIAAVTWIAIPAAAPAQNADFAVIQTLDDGLLAIMKGGKTMGFAGRSARIGPVVDRVFDIPLMTRLSVGPAWTTMTPADQNALVAAFRRMTVAQYAGNFDSWSGQAFALDPKVDARGGDRLVRTTLSTKGAAPVALSYRLRQSGGAWKIIDVFYRNSISQLATRRSDFAAVVQRGGAKALVAHLDALAAKTGG